MKVYSPIRVHARPRHMTAISRALLPILATACGWLLCACGTNAENGEPSAAETAPILWSGGQVAIPNDGTLGDSFLLLPDYLQPGNGQAPPATEAAPSGESPSDALQNKDDGQIWNGVGNESQGLTYFSRGDGTCAITGIGGCTDACVVIPGTSPAGDRVVAISDKAFYGCQSITAVYIPQSVTSIGAMAFGACPNLAYFTVDGGNVTYADRSGVLYTADATILVAYPPAKSTASVTIPKTVRMIADMAFYGASRLTTVNYEGDEAGWMQIVIGSGNNSLIGLSIRYLEAGK